MHLSIKFPPQTDWQFQMIIQVLEYILYACVIDFGGHWDQFFSLAGIAQLWGAAWLFRSPHLPLSFIYSVVLAFRHDISYV